MTIESDGSRPLAWWRPPGIESLTDLLRQWGGRESLTTGRWAEGGA